MDTRTEVTQFDDIDGSTEGVRTIPIAVDGQQVEVDLSSVNVDKLMAALEPYLSAGRKVGDGSSSRLGVADTTGPRAQHHRIEPLPSYVLSGCNCEEQRLTRAVSRFCRPDAPWCRLRLRSIWRRP